MPLISTTSLNSILDHANQFYLRAIGASGSVYGLGSAGVGVATANLLSDFNSLANIDEAVSLGGAIDALQGDIVSPYLQSQLSALIAGVQANVTRFGPSGTTSLDSYLSYLNVGVGGTWNALQNPSWTALYPLIFGASNPASAWNSYFEILQGATYAQGLGGLIVGTGFTAGTSVGAAYAGGLPTLLVSAITGSGVVTVTGTAFNPATKLLVTGVTWTVTASSTGTLALVPGTAPANSLIASCTGIAAAGGISAGTFYAQSSRPTGRPLLP